MCRPLHGIQFRATFAPQFHSYRAVFGEARVGSILNSFFWELSFHLSLECSQADLPFIALNRAVMASISPCTLASSVSIFNPFEYYQQWRSHRDNFQISDMGPANVEIERHRPSHPFVMNSYAESALSFQPKRGLQPGRWTLGRYGSATRNFIDSHHRNVQAQAGPRQSVGSRVGRTIGALKSNSTF